MFIPDPEFYTSRIKNSRQLSCLFCSHKFHKTENYFIFEMLKKKIWANFQRILPKKLSLSSQKYGLGIWDPGSGKKPIPDPGSRGQKCTGSRIRIRNTVKKRNLPEVFDVCLVSPSHQVVGDLLIVSLIDVRGRHSHNLRPLRRVLKLFKPIIVTSIN